MCGHVKEFNYSKYVKAKPQHRLVVCIVMFCKVHMQLLLTSICSYTNFIYWSTRV